MIGAISFPHYGPSMPLFSRSSVILPNPAQVKQQMKKALVPFARPLTELRQESEST
jgi:hypothetical protein